MISHYLLIIAIKFILTTLNESTFPMTFVDVALFTCCKKASYSSSWVASTLLFSHSYLQYSHMKSSDRYYREKQSFIKISVETQYKNSERSKKNLVNIKPQSFHRSKIF